MSFPPYWPFRCGICHRFVSNPRVRFNSERIVAEIGDCKRCGKDVELTGLSWDDWFDENFDVDAALFGERTSDVAAGLCGG